MYKKHPEKLISFYILLACLIYTVNNEKDDYGEGKLCEDCYQDMLRGIPLLEKIVLLFNRDGVILARHYRNDRDDTKQSKYFEHAEDQSFTMKLEVMKYTKDSHVEVKWEFLCYTKQNQMYDFVRILSSMQVLAAAILRGSNLNLEVHDLLHSTLANEIREQVARMQLAEKEKDEAAAAKAQVEESEEVEVGNLLAGLEDPHNAGESELSKSSKHSWTNQTRLKGQLLQSDNVQVVTVAASDQVQQAGLFVNGNKVRPAAADYEYIEQPLDNGSKLKILENLEKTLKSS